MGFKLKFLQNGIKLKFVNRKDGIKEHWLDYAEEKYGAELVMETKMVLNVLTLFIPIPIFWALYMQLSSRWVFQATQMNGDLGWYTINPDQMVMSTTLFIIILIPVFERVVYPILAVVGIKSPLQKMTLGFISSGFAFVMAAIVEWRIKGSEIHMLWLIPQYFVIAMAEVFLWVAVISFVYTQAPDSMKSVMTAFVYLTIAFGSLIIIAVSGTHFIKSQFYEFLFYASLMLINTILFMFLASRYKFVDRK